jgi:hypothetical protein
MLNNITGAGELGTPKRDNDGIIGFYTKALGIGFF